jgi:hypothetical protein
MNSTGIAAILSVAGATVAIAGQGLAMANSSQPGQLFTAIDAGSAPVLGGNLVAAPLPAGDAGAVVTVDVFSSTFAGATPGCSTRSTAGTNGLGLAYNTSLAYTDLQGNPQTLAFRDWTDVLALLYGGLDKSTITGSGAAQQGYSDCSSPQRRALAANWANLFEANGGTGSSGNTCSSNPSSACTTASYRAGAANITFGGQLRHAFRRDDGTSTADAFASIIGLGSLYAANIKTDDTAGAIFTDNTGAPISYAVSASKINGFGVTPYCNAMNWDTTAANEPSSTSHCQLHANKQMVGPGGVDQLFCSVGGAACGVCQTPALGSTATGLVCSVGGAACPSGSTAGTVCNCSGGVCEWDGTHKRPPPNTWGDRSFVQPASTNIGYDVQPTSYQDNDPIRRQCIGFPTQTTRPAEEVCNIDNPLGPGNGNGGQLGLVLSIPAVDWITQAGSTNCASSPCPSQAIYPTAKCTSFVFGLEMQVFRCATQNFKSNVCPDGSQIDGGCQVPNEAGGTSFCENYGGFWPAGTDLAPNDGRIFNLVAYDGTSTGGPILYPIPGSTTQISFTGAFGRIHMTEPVWDTSVSTTPPNLPDAPGTPQGPCRLTNADNQIACLTQADPCSVGFAADSARGALPGTDAMEINQFYPTAAGYPAH